MGGAQLVLIGHVVPIPTFGYRCVPTPLHPDAQQACRISEYAARQLTEPIRNALKELSRTPGVHYWDLQPLLCQDGWCDSSVPGTHIEAMFDDDHMTKAGSYYLWPFACEFMVSRGLLHR